MLIIYSKLTNNDTNSIEILDLNEVGKATSELTALVGSNVWTPKFKTWDHCVYTKVAVAYIYKQAWVELAGERSSFFNPTRNEIATSMLNVMKEERTSIKQFLKLKKGAFDEITEFLSGIAAS